MANKSEVHPAVLEYQTRIATMGGKARAKKLSIKRRKAIAKLAGIASGKARRNGS